MKAFQKIWTVLALLALCLGLAAPAFAMAPESADPDWEQVSRAVLERFGVNESDIHAGYRNLSTGEEHFINGDEYAVAASMFKVPLCMCMTEGLRNGSIDWSVYEQYFSYEDVQNDVLIDSSNERAYFLIDTFLGGYNEIGRASCRERV